MGFSLPVLTTATPSPRRESPPIMRFIETLSPETIHLLRRIYQQSQQHRVRQRAHCILLSFQRHSPRQLAQLFGVDRITIYHWLDAWDAKRFAGLYERRRKGRPPTFSEEQKLQIRQWARLFPKNLNQIRARIQSEFNLDASKQTIKRILKSFRFSWKRMRRRVPSAPDPVLYQERKAALETLREEDREGIIDLRYFDESGFCLVPYIPYAWQEAGETLAIESVHSQRLNVLGFMNKRHELDAYCIEGAVDSDVVIHCFDQFCHTLQGPTVVVVDNASIHTSESFQDRLPRWSKQGLEVFYLPPYAPELNLIEILWRFMKYEWIELWAYTSWRHLVDYVEGVIKDFGDKYKINFV
jgi:transposase